MPVDKKYLPINPLLFKKSPGKPIDQLIAQIKIAHCRKVITQC